MIDGRKGRADQSVGGTTAIHITQEETGSDAAAKHRQWDARPPGMTQPWD